MDHKQPEWAEALQADLDQDWTETVVKLVGLISFMIGTRLGNEPLSAFRCAQALGDMLLEKTLIEAEVFGEEDQMVGVH